MSDLFDQALDFVLDQEGGFQADPQDAGNWTSGRVGIGALRGTKWGISAAQFPKLDIAALTRAEAAEIYRNYYWDAINGDDLAPMWAVVIFDAAVLEGVWEAVTTFQHLAGLEEDGVVGPDTIAASHRFGRDGIAAYQTMRLERLQASVSWRSFGRGWTRRFFAAAMLAAVIGEKA